jgi:hypothetical protein
MPKSKKSRTNMVFVSPMPSKEWKVQCADAKRADSIHPTKADAVDRGRELSRNKKAELVIQKQDGQIAQKDSHGNDPRSIRG